MKIKKKGRLTILQGVLASVGIIGWMNEDRQLLKSLKEFSKQAYENAKILRKSPTKRTPDPSFFDDESVLLGDNNNTNKNSNVKNVRFSLDNEAGGATAKEDNKGEEKILHINHASGAGGGGEAGAKMPGMSYAKPPAPEPSRTVPSIRDMCIDQFESGGVKKKNK